MLNRAELIGRLGRDPEVRYTPAGKAIAHLAMATHQSYLDRESGEWKEQTEWHRVVLFGRLAETAEKHLKKGSLAFVDGRLRTRKWQNRDGKDQYTTELVGSALTLLNRKSTDSAESEQDALASSPPDDGAEFEAFPDIPF